jgi:hypothetical protein
LYEDHYNGEEVPVVGWGGDFGIGKFLNNNNNISSGLMFLLRNDSD